MFTLAIVYEYEIYLTHHLTQADAEAALLADVRETYAESDDLPDVYDESEISEFVGGIGDSYLWKIAPCVVTSDAAGDDFGHVESDFLRKVLGGDVSEDAICQALTLTEAALAEDEGNEDVNPWNLTARQEAFYAASCAWNDEGDMMAALHHLRECWKV